MIQYLTITFEGEEENLEFLKELIKEILKHRLDAHKVKIVDPIDCMKVCPICRGDL